MGQEKDIIGNLEGYSVAMYATWLYYAPARILFDAGEGVSLRMRNMIFGVESVVLSHGHYDHIGGLAGMIYSRASARGDKEKPLTVYYPYGSHAVDCLKDYLATSIRGIRYDLKWVSVVGGQEIVLGDDRAKVVAFPVEHGSGPALGYRLVEDRNRLKKEFVGLPGPENARIAARDGRGSFNEPYRKTILAYCGDSAPVTPALVEGAEVLVHEATFVDAKDMDGGGHSSVADAVRVAREAGVGSLVLAHVSGRYTAAQAYAEAVRAIGFYAFDKPVFLLYGGDMRKVTP